MPYKKPILVELLAELRFSKNLTDSALFDLTNAVRGGGWPEVEVFSRMEPQGLLPALSSVTRFRCWAPGKQHLAQISASSLTVNQVGEYLGWDSFKEKVVRLLDVMGSAAEFGSVSFQTIDQIEVPAIEYRLGRFVVCGGKYVPGFYESSTQPCDITLGLGLLSSDGFNRQLGLKAQAIGENMRLRWHSSFTDILQDDLLVRLEALHEESNEMFEAMITDETRRHMGGKV